MFFFSVQLKSLEFCFFPLEAKSSLKVTKMIKLKVAECVWFASPLVQHHHHVFLLVQPGKKDNSFFLHFFVVYLVPVHSGSILPSVLSMSPPCGFYALFHFISVCVFSALVQSFKRQCSNDSYQMLSKGDKKVSVKGRKVWIRLLQK